MASYFLDFSYGICYNKYTFMQKTSKENKNMNKFTKKLSAFLLAAVLLFSAVPAVPTTADTPKTTAANTEKALPASFCTAKMKINGTPNEEGWTLPVAVTADSMIGAQWDTETLYLAAYTPNKDAVSFSVNGVEITKDNGKIKTATNKKSTEASISFETLGISIKDYGTEIPLKVQIDNTVWEGTIVLTSTEWIASGNPCKGTAHAGIQRGGMRIVHPESKATENQNVVTISGGYNFYDRYAPKGENPPASFSRLLFAGDEYAALGDRTADTVFGFTFHAKSMPVYKLGADNDFYPFLMAGFNWYISASNENGDTFVSMAIINTDIGLVFVLRDADRDRTYILDKHEGDTFYLETTWTPAGDVILSIDGRQVAVFEDAEMPANSSIFKNYVVFNLLRSVEPAKSEEDTFDINVTGISCGKNYGDSLIDLLSFETIKNTGNEQYFVMKDLSLPATVSNDVFTTPVTIEWTSSDPAVVDPETGKVTRPETNGKLVTLTASAPSLGTSKEIEVFVLGLAPQDDVLVAPKDTATYKGTGSVKDVHTFTFDENNNSLIRDLKESKTVNVIALKDSDNVCRLNESNLTIWTSEDNKEYTEVESFKLLRDGQYTYLYDFEATGRYIKVHFTMHSLTDSDFTGPLAGMIEAYHEDIFGDGGSSFATESFVKAENGADTAVKDTICTVSAETAGIVSLTDNYADVRFYLGEELLYHCYDGKNFLVRVPDIAAGESVTLKVLSGNKDAKDISNTEAIYEVMYGTRETYSGYRGVYFITLNNGMMMGFHAQSGNLCYFISQDGGITISPSRQMAGTLGTFTNPHGSGYDEETGRILVQGYKQVDENYTYEAGIIYSDNNGNTWQQAEIKYENPNDIFRHTYSNIVKVSSYDGEDGPNVDFVIATARNSELMKEHYGHPYEHSEMTTLYTTDNGKTWTMSADAVRYYGGDDQAHIREHGLCEPSVMENEDGVLFLYSRCQYEETLHFAYGVSYDFGKTWSEEAVLSNIYATNTQPELFKMNGNSYILWGGNNVYGGGSYRRYPLNVAISYDGLYTFTDIQDLFLKTDYQGMVNGTCINYMNPNVTVAGDTMFVSAISDTITEGNNYRYVYVYNFEDYFFRTKGAYDSFETATSEYEGWAGTGGQTEASDAQATSGKKSMMFTPGSAAVRSLPAVSDGTIAFDLYIEDVTKTNLTLELETSHGPDYGKASPIGFALTGDDLTLLRGDTVNGILKNGWNHFEFELSLSAETPSASLSVNGGDAIAVPVESEIGDYICYVHIVCQGELTYYLDSFLVNDMDDSAKPTASAVQSEGSTVNTDTPSDSSTPSDTDMPKDSDSNGFPLVFVCIAIIAAIIIIIAPVLLFKKKK